MKDCNALTFGKDKKRAARCKGFIKTAVFRATGGQGAFPSNAGGGASTVSHHLSRLARAGLVEARAEGYYNLYSLQIGALEAMARRLLSRESLPSLADDIDLDSFDRKVLAAFTQPDGRLKAFPAQEKKYLVLLRHVVKAFEPRARYSEKQANEILARFHADTARLRRDLVD